MNGGIDTLRDLLDLGIDPQDFGVLVLVDFQRPALLDLEIRQGVEAYYSDVRVDDTSRPMRRKYGDLAWRFIVPPGEELLLYRLSALQQ